MTRKRDITPEALLQRVITGLEADSLPRFRADAVALLTHGPLRCGGAVDQAKSPDADLLTCRAELLQLARTLVRVQGQESRAGIGTYGYFVFDGQHVADGRVVVSAGAKDVSDLLKLQFVMLLHVVGLRSVHRCSARGCLRLFVKTYRREFCSVQCQQRDNKQRQRQHERNRREREQRRRRVAKGGR
jgi:hypothetical protein